MAKYVMASKPATHASTIPARMTVDDYKTAEAFVKAANLIHAIELIAEQPVGLALNDAQEYLNRRATEILDQQPRQRRVPDNIGDSDRWEDPRDTFGGETDDETPDTEETA